MSDYEAFQALTQRLVEEVRGATMHYDLYCALRKSVPEHGRALNRSRHFWSLTFNAHLEACRIALCRVYDQDRRSLGLRNWLEHFRDEVLPTIDDAEERAENHYSSPVSASDVEGDLALVSATDPLVKTLVIQRGNAVAHVSRKLADNGESVFHSYPLTDADFEKLIERAESTINRYSTFVYGMNHVMQTFESDDVSFVLDAIKRSIELDESA